MIHIKQCPNCGKKFSINDFLYNSEIKPIGMKIDDDLSINYYFFTHSTKECDTTFAIDVTIFKQLITEPIPEKQLAERKECEDYCCDLYSLLNCNQQCKFEPYRKLLKKMIENRTKINNPQESKA